MTERPVADRARTPLLSLITEESMDQDYLTAAVRRVRSGDGSAGGSPRRAAAAVLAVFGVLVATAAVQTSRNADVEDAGRQTLVKSIGARRAEVSAQQDQIVELRKRTSDLEKGATALASTAQTAESTLRRLQVRTGFVAVRGPGVRMVVDDPEQGVERIRKEDLFLLVNALWQAGAEAIALDGRRLTVVTSINNSNVAINVDDSALIPPYTLEAIGDPRTLAANVVNTPTFATFDALRSRYGFGFEIQSVQNEDALLLPAAPQPRLTTASADMARAKDDRREGANP